MEFMCIGGNVGVKVAAERFRETFARVTFACGACYVVIRVMCICRDSWSEDNSWPLLLVSIVKIYHIKGWDYLRARQAYFQGEQLQV